MDVLEKNRRKEKIRKMREEIKNLKKEVNALIKELNQEFIATLEEEAKDLAETPVIFELITKNTSTCIEEYIRNRIEIFNLGDGK